MSGFLGSDGSALIGGLNPLNIVRGVAVDTLGNVGTISNIQQLILNGQGFSAATGKLATATNANLVVGGLGIFNPANSLKSLLIYSLRVSVGNAGTCQSNLTTVDPAFGNALSAVNTKAGSAIASVAALSSSANGVAAAVTPIGSMFDSFLSNTNVMLELLDNGTFILLPAGVSSNGLAVYPFVAAAGNSFMTTARWVEF